MDRQLLQAILNNMESNSVGISFFSKGMKYLFVGTLVWQRTFVHVLIWMSDNLTILITMLQWVELCPSHPHHRFVRVWTPSISDCDLIWKQGLYRCNQIKMKSLGWVLIHSEHHPYQKGKLNPDMRTGRMTCEDEGRKWGDMEEAKEHQRRPENHQILGERHGTDSPPQPQKESQWLHQLYCRSSGIRSQRVGTPGLRQSVCNTSLRHPKEIDTNVLISLRLGT